MRVFLVGFGTIESSISRFVRSLTMRNGLLVKSSVEICFQ